jgi:hypothetical protein
LSGDDDGKVTLSRTDTTNRAQITQSNSKCVTKQPRDESATAVKNLVMCSLVRKLCSWAEMTQYFSKSIIKYLL